MLLFNLLIDLLVDLFIDLFIDKFIYLLIGCIYVPLLVYYNHGDSSIDILPLC